MSTNLKQMATKLRAEGLSWQEIAMEANKLGYRSTRGKKWTQGNLWCLVNKPQRKNPRRLRAVQQVATNTNSILTVIAEIVTHPNLDDNTKLEVVRRLV